MNIREIKKVTAKKEHLSSFSGLRIFSGEEYWLVRFKTNMFSSSQYYKVKDEEFPTFIKTKLYMTPGQDYVAMEKYVSSKHENGEKPETKRQFFGLLNLDVLLNRLSKNLRAGRYASNETQG